MIKPKYIWKPEIGYAGCTIHYDNLEFYGDAVCHPDDKDMMSRLTGQKIAETRAMIQYLAHVRDFELRPQVRALRQLYFSMEHSKKFNKKSYEAKMLYRHIRATENDYIAIKQEIVRLKQELKNYLNDKEELFQIVRKKRVAKIQQSEINNS